MKLLGIRDDGAKLWLTRTETVNNDPLPPREIDYGFIELPDGTKTPEKDILNLSKFNVWEEV